MYLALCVAIFARTAKQIKDFREQSLIARFLVVFVMMVMYISLNGMFLRLFHSEFFLVMLSTMIVKNTQEDSRQ